MIIDIPADDKTGSRSRNALMKHLMVFKNVLINTVFFSHSTYLIKMSFVTVFLLGAGTYILFPAWCDFTAHQCCSPCTLKTLYLIIDI